MLNLRKCAKCKISKELSPENYNRETRDKQGFCRYCRACKRQYNIDNLDRRVASNVRCKLRDPEGYKMRAKTKRMKALYGMSLQDYQDRFSAQGEKCLICEARDSDFHVDHCHSTGEVRGILCGTCNRGLGQFKDNITILLSAVDYLNQSKGKKNVKRS